MVKQTWINLRTIAALAILLFVPGFARAQNKDNVDDVKGARWEYEIFDGDELVVKGHFRVYDKTIYNGKEKIGSIDVISPVETKLIIKDLPTKKPKEKIAGTAHLKKVDSKPPEGNGRFVLTNGTKYRMKVIMKDR